MDTDRAERDTQMLTPPNEVGIDAARQSATAQVDSERAGFGTRLGALLLDVVVYVPLFLVAVAAAAIPLILLFAMDLAAGFEGNSVSRDHDYYLILGGGLALLVTGVLVFPIHYVYTLGRTGRSIGRTIVGIKVIDDTTGQPIGVGRAFIRALVAIGVSAPVIFLGFLRMLWDPNKQTWHDQAARSIVIRKPALNTPTRGNGWKEDSRQTAAFVVIFLVSFSLLTAGFAGPVLGPVCSVVGALERSRAKKTGDSTAAPTLFIVLGIVVFLLGLGVWMFDPWALK